MEDKKIDPNMDTSKIYLLVNFLFALTAILFLQSLWIQNRDVKQIPYSEFETLLATNAIDDIVVSEKEIEAKLKTPSESYKYIITNRIDPNLSTQLQKSGVKYSMRFENTFIRDLFIWVFPLALMFYVWFYIAKKFSGGLQSGMMSIGKSKAKIFVQTETKITFVDVAGVDEAKRELVEIVDFLKKPEKYKRLGSRMPKGVLLIGPPGTGKTLIAKAVAGEAGVPFFSTNGAEFVEMFVGVGAARVRDLFEQAKSKAPCIIFIDELDALGRSRLSSGIRGGNDEKEQTLNQLLAELDGFDPNIGIVLLAATNRPEILDPALLRAGRFDRQVLVDRPDKAGRIEILKLHVKKTTLDPNITLEKIAALTPGFTGADLENLVNEASLVAVRRNSENVSEADFTEAIERLTAGLEKKNKLINAFERKIVAHHEIGHALVAKATDSTDQIHKVSIIPRGIGALGYTIQRPTEDRYLMTKTELEKKMAILLGGRAAEKVIFNHFSTGAADDLDKVSDIAWNAITKYGMDSSLGDVVYDTSHTTFLGDETPLYKKRSYSEETAIKIDHAIIEIIKHASTIAEEILTKNKSLLLEGAALLLEKETLTETELESIFVKLKK